MGIIDIFSKRKKRREQATTAQPVEVCTYDELPQPLRVQIANIIGSVLGSSVRWNSMLGEWMPSQTFKIWEFIYDSLKHEWGVHDFGNGQSHRDRCISFFGTTTDIDDALDFIELAIVCAERAANDAQFKYCLQRVPTDAIQELNQRFQEHGVGYRFDGGQLIKIADAFEHAEVVAPALRVLSGKEFEGASSEFHQALSHYRSGLYKEAIVEALKSFESTMKSICALRKWPHDEKATAKPLINTLFNNGLIPQDLAAHFSGFRAALEAGLPLVRNRFAGHGQGAKPIAVPEYLAAYAIHLAAANILLLVEAHRAKK